MTLSSTAIGCCLLFIAGAAPAQTLKEYSAETRFQFDLRVSDAVLKAMLPQGWTLNAATEGPPKDVNLRVIFIDRQTINGADGKPVGKGSNQLVYLAVPVKDPAGAAVQLIIGGLTADPADAPGPFGNYLAATQHSVQRTLTSPPSGPATGLQEWSFRAASGEHIEMRLRYESGVGNKANSADVKFCSAKDPAMCQISRQEQVLYALRNANTNPPDRVKEFSFQAGGGSYAKLFDGTEKYMSWDNIVWINRSVMVP